MSLLLESNLPGLELIRRGKVRDVYAIDAERLLIVATDRISAFDVILGSAIPDKGRVLTQISLFWFRFFAGVPNHLISANVDAYPENVQAFRDQIEGRSMLVRRARMIDIECVARGYLSGSGWKEYQAHGTICGIPLPAGLRESDRLPAPIFTPATKAQSGHDENISFDEAAKLIGTSLATDLRERTLKIYGQAAA
jgi:phosphoribosylaminoimidazole-succinocarboxamide synthase